MAIHLNSHAVVSHLLPCLKQALRKPSLGIHGGLYDFGLGPHGGRAPHDKIVTKI